MIYVAMKFLWPEITRSIQARAQRIAEGLAAGDRGQKELAAAETRVAEIVKAARERALAIEQQAHVRANEIVEAAKQTATSEGQRLLEGARAFPPRRVPSGRDHPRPALRRCAARAPGSNG